MIKERLDFLNTEEFKSMVIELYNHFDSNFFYECEVIQSKEFFYIDDESLTKMKDLLDGNIKRLKTLNRYIFETEGFYRAKEFHPRLNGKYDLRTLPFKDFKESFPLQIYNSSLSLIEPIAQACLDKNAPELEESEHVDAPTQAKTIILDRIKEMGI